MKRTLSFILTMLMLFSSLPVSVFAEEIAEVVNEVQMEETTEIDESKIGNEVNVGNSMYYIEDGNLLLSIDYAKPQIIDTDVFWVIEDCESIYYAKLDGNITYIYNYGNDEIYVKLFCPIDCFDISGDLLYYLYNNEIFKLDMTYGNEETVYKAKELYGFYLDEKNNIKELVYLSDSGSDPDYLGDLDIELIAEESCYTGQCPANNLTFISNKTRKQQLESRISQYITNNSTVKKNLESGKLAIFLFEGGSDNMDKSEFYSDYEKYRMFAVCIVVKRISGVDTVVYACENCSTLPDRQLDYSKNAKGKSGWAAATAKDGTYPAYTVNHLSDYAALSLRKSATDYNIKSVYMTSKGYEEYNAQGINVHTRRSQKKLSSGSAWSEGCQLIGTQSNYADYLKFIEIVSAGLADYKKVYYRGNNIYKYTSGTNKLVGSVTIDRKLFVNEMKNMYKNNKAVDVIVENSLPLCSNCQNVGTKSFKYTGDGKCSCGATPYSYKTEKEYTQVWTRKSKTTYKKLYLRETPYANNDRDYLAKDFSTIKIHGVTKNADGGQWYLASAEGEFGYIVKYKVDADYERSDASDVNFSKALLPKEKLKKRESAPLRGYFSSVYPISEIRGSIMNSNGSEEQYEIVYPNAETYEISQSSPLNQNLKCNQLNDGTYYIKYRVKDNQGKVFNFYSYDINNGYGYKGYFNVGNVGNPPTIKINNIKGGKEAVISSSVNNAQIYYTLNNGKQTSIASGKAIKFKNSGSYTIKAWSVVGGKKSSEIVVSIDVPRAYKPSILEYMTQPGPIILDVDIDVNYGEKCAYVTIAGEGHIYYTTDGSDPTENSNKYLEPIPITESKTVKAISILKGYAPSEIETKDIIVKEPEPPTVALYNTKPKIAQGKTATVSWEKVNYATSYTASLYLGNECVETYTTTGTFASFNLEKKSDTQNFEYIIKVVATNFKGNSQDSNAVSVMAMHPVTVTFVDRITRTGDLTESKLEQVKERINEHEKNDRGYKLEGEIISIQKVDYDSLPSKPAVPSKKGFDFAGWSADLFQPAVADTTVYADYEIKYYTVKFYDIDDSFNRESQPLSDEKYMYTEEAVPPTDNKNEVGYALAGWTVDVANSDGTDYNYVDGDMIVDAVYKWANMDLPAVLDITSVIRDDKSYRVNIRLKNNNELTTQARVVVSLYTSEGKNVYSQISEQDLDLGNFSSWGTLDEITLIYSGKIAYAKAFLVAVENDRTGGALSPAARFPEINTDEEISYDTNSNYYKNNGYWGPWTAWSDTQATASEFVQVESKPQYRYRDKQTTTTDNTKTLSGWNYDHTDPRTGSWVYNGTNWVGTENSEWRKREVSTNWVAPTYKTQWHYFTWYKGSSAPWSHYSSSHPYLAEIWIDYSLPWNRYSGGLDQYGGSGYDFGYSFNRWLKADGSTYGLPTSSTPYFTRDVQTGGGYTEYSYRDTYYTHHFWKWGNWSSWSDYYPTTSSNREIASKTQWRSREWIFNYDPSNEPEEESNFYPPIEGVLNSGETEYITEDELNAGNYSVLSGPYYKDDDGNYVDIENRNAVEYRYSRYTNGTYVMPCKELAEELYGGEWQLEYTDWSETEAENINESIYSCENIEHTHAEATQKEGVNYWDEYLVDGKSYCFVESRELTKEITFTDTNKYYLVNKDLEGKVATVLVYKKTNTDPTQGQLEYADQITVGSGNTYNITINTKELCEYGKTDDFIVSIALEGCKKLLTVGVIEAEAPQYEVCFTVNGEEYIPDCNKNIETIFVDEEDGNTKYTDDKGNVHSINTVMVTEGESIDVNAIGIPEVEGYRFVKWDKSLVNITGRVDVKAVLEKEDYAIVFVDHANETVELQELYYGDPISAPEVKPVEGKIFKGWDNQSYRYVLEENKDNQHYTIVDGPYYKISNEVYIPVNEYSDEQIVDGTKYYRVITDEIPVVTGNTVVTAIWETISYKVKFCNPDGTVIDEQEVVYGDAAEPPAPISIDGIQRPWNTNGQTWWNVTEDMIIYPYEYIENNIVAPIADVASGEYEGFQVLTLETQEETPIYYTIDVEISQNDAENFVASLSTDTISLLSSDETENSGEMIVAEQIQKYNEPILLTENTMIYAFTVQNGEVSMISVYNYEINEGISEIGSELDSDTPQITMPNITAKPGETVTVPVSIKNNPGVSNLSLVFAYDAENLTLLKAENGDVFKNSEYSSDLRDEGSCKFTWLSSTENTNDGTLLSLQFKVGEKGGNYSIDMSIEEAETSEEEMPFVTQDANIENVGDKAQLGDVNGDGNINFADAIVLLRFDIGFAELSDYQQSIADVNNDGDVDFADAIKILRFDAGLISSLK